MKNYKSFIIAPFILAFSYISLSFNGLKLADNEWFLTNQLTSEQLVLEGLLRANETKEVGLGRYERINTGTDPKYTYEYFERKNVDGFFVPYESHYGFQVRLLKYLSLTGCDNLSCYHSVTAIIMSLLITSFFLILCREFGIIPSLFFSATFFTSAWFIVFAKNLYWLPFSWFVPTLITIFVSIFYKKNYLAFIFFMTTLFFAYLINALFRYEYLTVVGLSSCLPIIYILIKKNFSKFLILRLLIYNFLVFLLSFLLALTIHAYSINKNIINGYSTILHNASKRIQSTESKTTIINYCGNNLACIEDIKKNFEKSTVLVVGEYFIFPAFLPGTKRVNERKLPQLYNGLKCSDPPGCIEKFRSSFMSHDYSQFLKELFLVFFSLEGLNWLFDRLVFLIFFLISVLVALRSSSPVKITFIFSLIAPLSWFILAKPHSDAHYDVNYIVWYLSYIPFSVLMISQFLIKKFQKSFNY